MRPLDAAAAAESDIILRELQAVMFAYDVGILKRADRLEEARRSVEALDQRFAALAAPHTHELVRLKETEAMLLAARLILGASLERTESRLSHFREDYPERDDANWLVWIDVSPEGSGVRDSARRRSRRRFARCCRAPAARRGSTSKLAVAGS